MISPRRLVAAVFFVLLTVSMPLSLYAANPDSEVGVIVMHGKGGQPGKYVNELASSLKSQGFQVSNLEMPWSGRRQYDVTMREGAAEIARELEGMRSKGVRKMFVIGHSQGGLFALYYAGQYKVDGVIAITPAGMVDNSAYKSALGQHVAKAKQMVAEGRGNEKSDFGDLSGSTGVSPVRTTAAVYLDWFDPSGAHTTQTLKKVKEGSPVLYVAPKHDYPGLVKSRQEYFSALPSNPLNRIYEPDSDHLNAPAASAEEIIRWIRQVSGM